MDLLLRAPAGSLILNNFINVNGSYAHINERINSLGLVALQLMIYNKQRKMLSNFFPSNDTLPQKSSKLGPGLTLGWRRLRWGCGRKKALQLVGGLPEALQEKSSVQCSAWEA